MASSRRIGLALLAALSAVSMAPLSLASGETSATPPTKKAAPAPHKKKPARTRHKKSPSAITTLTPRTSSRLTFAAKAEIPRGDGVIDESALPSASAGSCPSEMVSIESRYCIDKWEASLVEMDESGEHPFSPFLVVEGHDVRAVSAPGVFPQGYVSGRQAGAACERAGKRLCSSPEWRKACVGPRQLQYGYGDTRERGRCNDAGRSPMRILWNLGGDSSPSDWNPLKMNDERLNQLPGSLARTGEHADCTNEYGVHDMVGNLHEWTSDPGGTFQGGYYLDTTINGEGCAYTTTAHDITYHDYSTGFRCCADPR